MANPIKSTFATLRCGYIIYNGFLFPPTSNVEVSFTPEWDSSGRVRKWTRIDLKVDFTVLPGMDFDPINAIESQEITSPGSTGFTHPYGIPIYNANNEMPTDEAMDLVRRTLQSPGKSLEFSIGTGHNQSISNHVSPSRTYRIKPGEDMNFGPKPKTIRVVSMTPHAHQVSWECSTWVRDCGVPEDQTGNKVLNEFTFTVSWGIQPNGTSNRTISGSAEVPLSLPNLGTPIVTADQLRDNLDAIFPRLLQFQRQSSTNLSADRKRLDFSITDIEIESDAPYFPYLVSQKASLRGSSSLMEGAGFNKWAMTLDFSCEVAPGTNKLYGWLAFSTLFYYLFKRKEKGEWKGNNTTDSVETVPPDAVKKGRIIITNLSFEDELYGRNISISVGYTLFTTLKTIFKASGIFMPVEINKTTTDAKSVIPTWSLWGRSLANHQKIRGWQELGMSPNEDVIIQLCTAPTYTSTSSNFSPKPPPYSNSETSNSDPKLEGNPPDETWAAYQPHFHLETSEETVEHRPLNANPQKQDSLVLSPTQKEFIPVPSPSSPSISSVLHKVANTTYKVVFWGYAVRLGLPITPPSLVSYGGAKAIKVGTDQIKPTVIGSGVDVVSGERYSVNALIWRKEYILEKAPTSGIIQTDGHKNAYV